MLIFLTSKIEKLKYYFFLSLPIFLLGLFSVHRGQDINYDVLNYHLYNPYALLNNRLTIDYSAAGLQSYFNPFLDLLHYFLFFNLKPEFGSFILGFLQGLNFIFIYKIYEKIISRYNINKKQIYLISILSIFSSAFLTEIGTSFNDNITSIFTLIALNLVLDFLTSSKKNKFLVILAGFIAGVTVALKLTNFIYVIAIGISFILIQDTFKNKLQLILLFFLFSLVGFFLIDLYWLVKVYKQYGNPFFPLYNNFFQSQFVELTSNLDKRFIPKSLLEFFFYPIYFTFNPYLVSEIGYKNATWCFIAILLILVAVKKFYNFIFTKSIEKYDEVVLFFLAFFGLSYIFWLVTFGIFRYICTIDLIAPGVALILLHSILKEKTLFFYFPVFLLISFYNFSYIGDFGHAPWSHKSFYIQDESKILLNETSSATLFIGTHPSAFIIPIINKAEFRFVQIENNFGQTDFYWSTIKDLIYKSDQKLYFVYDSDVFEGSKNALSRLQYLGLSYSDSDCKNLFISLGQHKYNYKYCPLSLNLQKTNSVD